MSQSTSGYAAHDNRGTATPRHSADDALDDRDYQLLLEATYELGDYYDLETRLAVLCLGRLGLRVGELVHMREQWIDWRRRMIEIPRRDPCTKGRDGGVCGYCRQLAEQQVSHNDDISMDEALSLRWRAKTDSAARSVPFDFHAKAEIVIEQYFDRFSEFQTSKSGVHRRLEKAVDRVETLEADGVYPHCLRATAASHHASRGLDAISLQSLMGWADLSTAHRYVRRSGDRTRRALQSVHSR
jgi:integrase